MANAILITTAVLIVTGLAIELAAVAEETSNKALDFGNEMSNAIDCAIVGQPIEDCSPSLGSSDTFRQDATGFVTQVEEWDEELSDLLDSELESNQQ